MKRLTVVLTSLLLIPILSTAQFNCGKFIGLEENTTYEQARDKVRNWLIGNKIKREKLKKASTTDSESMKGYYLVDSYAHKTSLNYSNLNLSKEFNAEATLSLQFDNTTGVFCKGELVYISEKAPVLWSIIEQTIPKDKSISAREEHRKDNYQDLQFSCGPFKYILRMEGKKVTWSAERKGCDMVAPRQRVIF